MRLLTLATCLTLASCATIGYEQTIASHAYAYADVPLETVWDASIQAIMDMHHSIESIDREDGLILARGGEGYTQDKASLPMLTILIKEIEGEVIVTCQYNTLDIFVEPKKRIGQFFDALNERLK